MVRSSSPPVVLPSGCGAGRVVRSANRADFGGGRVSSAADGADFTTVACGAAAMGGGDGVAAVGAAAQSVVVNRPKADEK